MIIFVVGTRLVYKLDTDNITFIQFAHGNKLYGIPTQG